jgi:uncharacterized protein YbjT (DUF2867 family)
MPLPLPLPVRALVRSSAAAQTLAQSLRPADTEIRCTDYTDLAQMADALAGCSAVIHLVGILRETPGNRYVDAHERAVSTLVAAAQRAGVRHIVALSILGADEQSSNACLRSRGRADQLLRSAPLAGTVLEVPMVLGGDDHASRALAARARRALSFTFRAESLEQPIDIEDVVSALLAWRHGVAAASQAASSVRAEAGAEAGTHTGMPSRLQLAGPVSLTRRALVQAAAARVGKRTRVVSLPLTLAYGLAGLCERLLRAPPITRAMLGVLDHDDEIDPAPALAVLGLTLTPLSATLDRVMAS